MLLWSLALGAWCFSPALLAHAVEEKKEDFKKAEPPLITLSLPSTIENGRTNKVIFRGLNLTNMTELRFTNGPAGATISLRTRTVAEVPKGAEAKKLGDTQIEADLFLPGGLARSTNYLVAVSPAGASEPFSVPCFPQGQRQEEKEPNGSFRQAQAIDDRTVIEGGIGEPGDVDVFQFSGRAGQMLEVMGVAAAGPGTTMDPLLTLYDSSAHVLASNDDTGNSANSVIRHRLPQDGKYLLLIQDAHDKGGLGHRYWVEIRVASDRPSRPEGSPATVR